VPGEAALCTFRPSVSSTLRSMTMAHMYDGLTSWRS